MTDRTDRRAREHRAMTRRGTYVAALMAVAADWPAGGPAQPTQPAPLIVVEDRGGASALPYYRALNLQPLAPETTTAVPAPVPPARRIDEADFLPVRSPRLTPGDVAPRAIDAPGLRPLFLIGDDARSRAWLRQRAVDLGALGAVGLVVNVETGASLDALRRLAPGLTLVAASGDDLAVRLGLDHYPALVTATGIGP